jgi:hypothetical protein
VGVQTDFALDRPPTPLFVPPPAGVDEATQIGLADLFDFDREVAPLLDVLVGKTLVGKRWRGRVHAGHHALGVLLRRGPHVCGGSGYNAKLFRGALQGTSLVPQARNPSLQPRSPARAS